QRRLQLGVLHVQGTGHDLERLRAAAGDLHQVLLIAAAQCPRSSRRRTRLGAAPDLRATSPRCKAGANTSATRSWTGVSTRPAGTGRLPGASSGVQWVTGEAIACPSATGEKMASSSHNGKKARTSATAAG